jgi:hypothetical protein
MPKEHIGFRFREVLTACENLILFLSHTGESDEKHRTYRNLQKSDRIVHRSSRKGLHTLYIAMSEEVSVPNLEKTSMTGMIKNTLTVNTGKLRKNKENQNAVLFAGPKNRFMRIISKP